MPARFAASVAGLACSLAAAAYGQDIGASDASSADAPPFQSLRYNEDYRYLLDPSRRTDAWDRLKYIPLGADPDLFFSLGGELRGRAELSRNPDFNFDRTVPRNDYLLGRALLHADLHLGPRLRVFGQLGYHPAYGEKASLGPTQQNRIEAQQAFADFAVGLGQDAGTLTLRGGRQEISLGSSRLVSVREGPNVRRAFDGGRAIWRRGEGEDAYVVNAFVTRPVENRDGSFDDRSNPGQAFWGLYATAPLRWLAPGGGVDLYYFGYERDDAGFTQGQAFERRHTVGARWFGKTSGFDWDLEAAAQFGRFGAVDIRAWTVASDVGYTFAGLPGTPRLGLKANIASGDGNPGDGRLETFNPLFPRLPYFTEVGLIAPANIMDIYPSLTIKPAEDVEVFLGWNALWRHRAGDGFYAPPLQPVPGTEGGSRFIGHQTQVLAEWQATRHLELRAAYVHFSAGATIRKPGGRNVDFVLLSASYKW